MSQDKPFHPLVAEIYACCRHMSAGRLATFIHDRVKRLRPDIRDDIVRVYHRTWTVCVLTADRHVRPLPSYKPFLLDMALPVIKGIIEGEVS